MQQRKPIVFVGSTLRDLQSFPAAVQRTLGYALHIAQLGGKHPDAKPLKGYSGAGVLEVVEDQAGNTYRAVYTVRLGERVYAFRAVYTVRLGERVYALHAFEKKSKRGIATPKKQLDLIRARLADAEELHRQWLEDMEGV